MKNKKNKVKYIDDGHTIYSMEGLRKHKEGNLEVNKKERKAIIKAAFQVYLPVLIIILIGFTLAILLIYFWLN